MDEDNQSLDDLIASVGIPISKNDPIHIQFALMNHQMSQFSKKQDELLEQFQQELLSCRLTWEQEAQAKAERVMNFALKTGRERLEDTALTCMHYLRKQQIESESATPLSAPKPLLLPLAVGMMLQFSGLALLLLWLR